MTSICHGVHRNSKGDGSSGNQTGQNAPAHRNQSRTERVTEGKQSLWVYDLSRETWSRLTSENDPEWLPTWTPEGEFLAFRAGKTLAWTRSDGSGAMEHLVDSSRNAGPWSFSPDGRWLAFWPLQPDSDLFRSPVERTAGKMRLGEPQLRLQQPGSKGASAISPDNHWLAYSSAYREADGKFRMKAAIVRSGPGTANRCSMKLPGSFSNPLVGRS